MSPDKSSFSSSSFLKRWKKLIELAQMAGLSIGLWAWEMPADGLVWSDETYRQLGYTRDTFSGRGEDFFRRLHLEDRPRVEEAVQRVLAGGSVYDVKFRVVRPDGSICWLHSCGVLVHPGASRMVGICIDITGLEDMEAQLQRSEERMRLAFDAAKIGFWDRNTVTGETVWSATASRQLGLPDGSPMSFAIFMNAVHPDDRKAVQESLERAIRDKKDHAIEYRVLWPDGSSHWRFDKGSAFYGATGRPERILGIVIDIDERKAADERLQLQGAALQAAANSIVITDNQGTILWTNQAFLQLTGYGAKEVLGKNPRLLKSGEHDDAFYTNMWATITSGNIWHGELTNRRKDGSLYTEEMTITPLHIGTGGITHYVAVKQDVTSRRIAEDKLRRAEEKYRSIFEDAVIGIFQTTPDWQPIILNRSLARMYGYDSPEQLLADVPKGGRQLIVDPNLLQELAIVLEKDRVVHRVELEINTKDGNKRWALANVRAVSDADGNVVLHEGTVEDITQRKAAEERVQFLAYYDELTGLPNRTLLHDRVQVALASARRHREKVALLLLDLDHFKTINDSLGHPIGDLLLQEVAKRLKRWTREQDTVAHLGGDEFLVLVTAVNETADAVVVAERIVNSMAAELVIQGHAFNITCSLGISIFPDNGEEVDALLKNADLAMYKAKGNGRHNLQLFTQEMNAQLQERMTLERSLRLAVEREEFFLVYQPQFDLATGEIIGCEALIRWRHPELGLVLPNMFIPLAESSGLIGPMGEWVLKTACAQARQWQDEGLPAVPIAVNVSAVQFRQQGFLRLVKTVLRETGLAPQYLELELTESLLLSNADGTLSMLQQLKGMGLKLSIDDFGTGYSSLSYLRQFPIYKLKIDRSFVRDITVDPDDAVITSTIISMAQSLGLKVLAEGVETEEQMSFLRAHNCHEVQGHYFSKPLDANELADKLRSPLPVEPSRAEMAARAEPELA
jgi:diguanylate cyclase (GGDEF)-like protein/PAS domain S-box-containing protein